MHGSIISFFGLQGSGQCAIFNKIDIKKDKWYLNAMKFVTRKLREKSPDEATFGCAAKEG